MPSYLKTATFRSEPLRRLVTRIACVRCGVWGYNQGAHMGGLAEGKGRGLKVSDARVAALCGPRVGIPGCHAEVGDGRGDEGLKWVALTYIALVEAGELVPNPREGWKR